MAGGPYKGKGGWYYCKWSDKRGHPDQPKKTESLKTKKKKIANKRLSILETLYGSGYHKPWKVAWHSNNQIKSIVYSGHLDLNALQNGQIIAKGVTLHEAAEEEEDYQPESNNINHRSHQVSRLLSLTTLGIFLGRYRGRHLRVSRRNLGRIQSRF
jgi:hypothetical protein